MGMFVRAVLHDSATLGSPGVEEIRWLAPVRPGDTLRGRSTILDVRDSLKDPRRGTVHTVNEVRNQDDVVVMTLTARGFFRKRPT
jgi:acyl dehydratase